MPVDSYTLEILIWTLFYLGSCILFFGIAVWVIIRGGKDIHEILTEAFRNSGDHTRS